MELFVLHLVLKCCSDKVMKLDAVSFSLFCIGVYSCVVYCNAFVRFLIEFFSYSSVEKTFVI